MALRSILQPFGQMPGPLLLALSLFGWTLMVMRTVDQDLVDQTMALCSSGRLTWVSVGPPAHVHLPIATDWLAMVLAMAPLVLRNELARLWRSNLPRRRWLATVGFACGYGLPWTLLVLALVSLSNGGIDAITAAAFGGAVVAWHCSPLRQRCLRACHGMPTLRAFGATSLVDAGRYGLRSGLYCCVLCGPAMVLAMNLPVNHLVSMTLLTPFLVIERYFPARISGWGPPLFCGRPQTAWVNLAPPPCSHTSHS